MKGQRARIKGIVYRIRNLSLAPGHLIESQIVIGNLIDPSSKTITMRTVSDIDLLQILNNLSFRGLEGNGIDDHPHKNEREEHQDQEKDVELTFRRSEQCFLPCIS